MSVKQKQPSGKAAVASSATVFVFDRNPDAKEVFLVGDFNNWNPMADRMVKNRGAFRKTKQLAPGEYQYKFLVDGEWHTDPSAPGQVPNSFGTMNSLIHVRDE